LGTKGKASKEKQPLVPKGNGMECVVSDLQLEFTILITRIQVKHPKMFFAIDFLFHIKPS
jgi:hypothetical protein